MQAWLRKCVPWPSMTTDNMIKYSYRIKILIGVFISKYKYVIGITIIIFISYNACKRDSEATYSFGIDNDLVGNWVSDGKYISADNKYTFTSRGTYNFENADGSNSGEYLSCDTAIWDDGNVMEGEKSLFLYVSNPDIYNPTFWYSISSDKNTLSIIETAGGLEEYNRY
jgi:hypothetical protein